MQIKILLAEAADRAGRARQCWPASKTRRADDGQSEAALACDQDEKGGRWAERAERGSVAMITAVAQKVGVSVGTTRDQAPHAWQKVGRIWQKVGFTITPNGRVWAIPARPAIGQNRLSRRDSKTQCRVTASSRATYAYFRPSPY